MLTIVYKHARGWEAPSAFLQIVKEGTMVKRIIVGAFALTLAGLLSVPVAALVDGGSADSAKFKWSPFSDDRQFKDFYIWAKNDEGTGKLHTFRFDTSKGWDFGDRIGYGCAYVWLYEKASSKMPAARVTIQRLGGNKVEGKDYMTLNDRDGKEPKPQTSCPVNPGKYKNNKKPKKLTKTVFAIQRDNGKTIARYTLPATSSTNSNVWFEMDKTWCHHKHHPIHPQNVGFELYEFKDVLGTIMVEVRPAFRIKVIKDNC
jgi:hypothetical protein